MVFQRIARVAAKALLIGLLVLLVLPVAARLFVWLWSTERTYPVDSVPERRVAIVPGARVYSSGRLSAMLADRVGAAVDLYHAGKVDALLMTGDNSTAQYNEPGAMREQAIALGVLPEDVVADYGGRRTYDSCYRARFIFQVSDAVVVTQGFHLPRALMLCNALGIDAVGVAADYQRPTGYSRYSLTHSTLREYPATLAALLDLLRRPEPPVMGEPLPIFPREQFE